MTRSSKLRSHTDAFKISAVEAFTKRGRRSVEEMEKELGVRKHQLYEWSRRIKVGEPLTKPRGVPPRKKPASKQLSKPGKPVAEAATSRKPGVLMRAKKQLSEPPAQSPPPSSLHLKLEEVFRRTPHEEPPRRTSPLALSERDELVLLRDEVRKLKRVLAMYLELGL